MIHYHGTPAGGDAFTARRFLQGRHALVPFARPDHLDTVAAVCQSFVLDNSAFTLWRSGGGDVDVAAYHAWVHELAGHPALDWCLIPDKIDGSEEDNVELVMTWVRMGSRVKGVPVWHLDKSLDYLEWLVRNFDTVALGSSGNWKTPGTPDWWVRMGEAMGVLCDHLGRARCRIHGLRMLDPDLFGRLPLASADSANAAINAGTPSRFGRFGDLPREQRADLLADQAELHQSAARWIPSPQKALFA